MQKISWWVVLLGFVVAADALPKDTPTSCDIGLLVLGVAQDGGKPQVANPNDPAWQNPASQRLATSIAIIDHRDSQPKRWIFDATPDFKQQLQRLDQFAPTTEAIGLDGIFLTHAHIGHYTGLMLLGHESVGAKGIPVYAMPRMVGFLSNNGPWDQLVRFNNIQLKPLAERDGFNLAKDLSVTAFKVPHRQEYSEVVGFRIAGTKRSAIYLPDIDSWEEWDTWGMHIEELIEANDLLFLDATFYANGEIPGRDMSGFPHPMVSHSMQRLAELATAEKAKVHFIHMNHTNPLHDSGSAATRTVLDNGFKVAQEGQVECL